jgi:hypothetical protein
MIRALKRTRGVPIPLARRRAQPHSTPAPVAGWNARDSIASMKEDEAVILDNWFPEESWVRVRRGYIEHTPARVYLTDETGEVLVTEDDQPIVFTHGIDGTVESLMAYNGPAANKLFAAVNGEIMDITIAGEPLEPAYQGLSNDRWQHTMFGNSAGNFLYIVNGEDEPRYFDGSTWTIPSLSGSGLTTTNLVHIAAFKQRLFFAEVGSLSFWYPANVETISGTLVEFRLDAYCKLGGYLMAIATWTRDGGAGIDDLAVFITSEGEALLFAGTDPGSANTWALIGTFYIGKPIGRRCFVKWGADLIVVTESGFLPLSRVLTAVDAEEIAISNRISGAVSEAALTYMNNFGWQAIIYPTRNMAIFNIPVVEGTTIYQYVMNTTTRAWCRFTGLNASCWEVSDGHIYFGTLDAVYHYDDDDADLGENIQTDALTSFSYFKRRGVKKALRMVRPVMETIGSAYIALEANMDFKQTLPTAVPTFQADEGSAWDVAEWDVASWGAGVTIQKNWKRVSGLGIAAALRMRTSTRGLMKWNSIDWLFETAGPL